MLLLPWLLVELACGEGCEAFSGGGTEKGDCVDGEGFEGYFLVAAPAATRRALEAEEPIVGYAES